MDITQNMTGGQVAEFHAKMVRSDVGSCWPWIRSRSKEGYGRLSIGTWSSGTEAVVLAHRVAYSMAFGDIPTDMCVCHRCDNPPCCNPEHLFLGTRADNNRDRDAKGRGRSVTGADVAQAKLTDEDVLVIRGLYADGVTQVGIGKMYNMTQGSISKIIRRATWKHV